MGLLLLLPVKGESECANEGERVGRDVTQTSRGRSVVPRTDLANAWQPHGDCGLQALGASARARKVTSTQARPATWVGQDAGRSVHFGTGLFSFLEFF